MRQILVGGILLSTAVSSSAITLGNHSGSGVLGRPLDMRVEAFLAAGEGEADICLNAVVLYGETRLAPSAVRTTLQRAMPDAQASVRVQATVPIDEPVVTVELRAGCTAAFTRRYVLLADPLVEPAQPAAPQEAGGAASARPLPDVSVIAGNALPAPAASAPGSAAAARGTPSTAGVARAPRSAAERPRPPARTSPPRANRVVRERAAPPPAVAAPRLELDAIDLSPAVERDPTLKLSPSLLSEPASSEEVRAAAGGMWRALNASPEDALRDADKLAALTAEFNALRAAQASSEATISELSARVEQSRQWQWLSYGLVVLLGLALLALFWLWRQQKTRPQFADEKAWWAQEEESKRSAAPMSDASKSASPVDLDFDLSLTPEAAPAKWPLSRAGQLQASPATDGLDVDLDIDSTPSPLAVDRVDFSGSHSASRSVAAEELFDVQQQADFFISLGQDEQAIKVLCDHIAESQVPSPLAYLDLLKIYHRLDRRDDYEQLRADFNGMFNAGAPAFDQFSDEGRGLEFYERALARIQALWPEPRVLDVIEQSIFREVGDPQAEVFDLEAYRELLLLYAMAKEMIERQSVDSKQPKDFENTKVQALKATVRRAGAPEDDRSGDALTLPMEQQPPASPNLGLDVNLDDLSEFSAFEASLPEVDVPVEPSTAQGARRDDSTDLQLIDFDVLDFAPPDETTTKDTPDRKKP